MTPPAVPARPSTPRRFLAAVVIAGLLLTINYPRVLTAFGLEYHGVWFLDSYAILAANDAAAAGLNPYQRNPLDILERNHVYSDWWFALGALGLTREDNFLFGGLCVLGFLTVALAGARPGSWKEAAGHAAVFLSPPVLLAVNRANNDLVVFTLIGTGLWLRQRTSPSLGPGLLTGALIGATGLKYYPAAAIAALAILAQPGRAALLTSAIAGLATAAVLWSERAALARGAFALPDSVYLFGAPVLWRDLPLGRGGVLALSTILTGLAGWWLAGRGHTRGLRADPEDAQGREWLFAVGACLLVGCFLAGTSFAYRWIFALWLWPWLWTQAQRSATAPRPWAPRAALWLLLISLWQDGLFCLTMNLGFGRMPAWLDTVWRYATQPANWLLVALLTGWLLDAAWRAATGMFRPTELPIRTGSG